MSLAIVNFLDKDQDCYNHGMQVMDKNLVATEHHKLWLAA
jgi:hypothetical protein